MGKQPFAHARQGALADDDLQHVDQVFEQTGGDHGHQIDGAVLHQQIDVAQADGLVGDVGGIAGRDEGLARPLVERSDVDALQEVEEGGEGFGADSGERFWFSGQLLLQSVHVVYIDVGVGQESHQPALAHGQTHVS